MLERFFCFRIKEDEMSSDKVVVKRGGVGFCGLLFIVLLLLKVGVVETQVTQWSWWTITAPLWGPTVLVLGIWATIVVLVIVRAPPGSQESRRRAHTRR